MHYRMRVHIYEGSWVTPATEYRFGYPLHFPGVSFARMKAIVTFSSVSLSRTCIKVKAAILRVSLQLG